MVDTLSLATACLLQWQLVWSEVLQCWAVKCLSLVDEAGVLGESENAKRVNVLTASLNSCRLKTTT